MPSSKPLLVEAEKAEGVGSVFALFKRALPPKATLFTGLISELFAISNALREIDAAIQTDELNKTKHYTLIRDDLTLVRGSLVSTLKKLIQIFGDIGSRKDKLTVEAYARTWKEIDQHFTQNGGTLLIRLGIYRQFLQSLNSVIRRSSPDQNSIKRLRQEVQHLNTLELNTQFEEMKFTQAGPRKTRSYERERPPTESSSTTSPVESIPPLSPTSTLSNHGTNAPGAGFDHWAMRVFDGASSTALPRSSARTECFDKEDTDEYEVLQTEFEFLFDLKFKGDHPAAVGLYVLPEDHRVMICFETERRRNTIHSCRPLHKLEFRRSENVLHLLTQERGKLYKWATIKFKTIERLAIYHCTLVALRAYDASTRILHIRDFELDGEKEVFGGTIEDDGYLHALRMYRDTLTKSVRLVASVYRGELKNTPVWTAFIHFSLTAGNAWLLRSASNRKRVVLCDLRRHVTAPEYTPMKDRNGRHILEFTTSSDADDFVSSIQDMFVLSQPTRDRRR